MTQRKGPRLVNPNDAPAKAQEEKIPWKTIILTAVVTGAASLLGSKLLEYTLQKGKQLNPFAGRGQNPGGPQFQSPYSHLAQSQGLPVQPMEMPQMPTEELPPKWAQEFMAMHERRLGEIEQRLGPYAVPDEGDENAA